MADVLLAGEQTFGRIIVGRPKGLDQSGYSDRTTHRHLLVRRCCVSPRDQCGVDLGFDRLYQNAGFSQAALGASINRISKTSYEPRHWCD